jgi:PhnB protein
MPGDVPPEAKDRIMHACLMKDSKVLLMASDTLPGSPCLQGSNFRVMIPCESAEEIDRLFGTLGQNGRVTMPLQSTFWAARFGMVKDQFGINWMLNFEKPNAA